MATPPAAGQLIRASDSFSLVTFTPTFSGWTLGTSPVSEGWYQMLGSMVLWGMRLEWGTTPVFTSSLLMNFPVAAYASSGGTGLAGTAGTWGYRTGATSNYSGSCMINDAGGVAMKFAGAWNGTTPSDNFGRTATTTPVAPAAGFVLSASGVYRAA